MFMNTQKLTILNSNDNVNNTFDPDQTLKETSYTGGQLLPDFSEFKKVLKRRKSRQSTKMPGSIDFEYIGNDAGSMHYLIGKSNQAQLNFNLNLRRYKPTGNFKAEHPWHYPANRAFAPAVAL